MSLRCTSVVITTDLYIRMALHSGKGGTELPSGGLKYGQHARPSCLAIWAHRYLYASARPALVEGRCARLSHSVH